MHGLSTHLDLAPEQVRPQIVEVDLVSQSTVVRQVDERVT